MRKVQAYIKRDLKKKNSEVQVIINEELKKTLTRKTVDEYENKKTKT